MRQVVFDQVWLPSLVLVVVLHVAVWWGYTHFESVIVPPRPLPVVQVTLLAPPTPPAPRVIPLQSPPPKVEPHVEPHIVRKAMSAPTPVPVVPALAEQVMQQAPVVAAPPSPPVSAPPPPTLAPVVELPRYHAAYLSNPPPDYPLAARRRGIVGTVLVRAEVSAGGECLRVELNKTSGHEMLDQAALEAVKMWRFVPAKRGNQAVVAWVEVPITFKLENN